MDFLAPLVLFLHIHSLEFFTYYNIMPSNNPLTLYSKRIPEHLQCIPVLWIKCMKYKRKVQSLYKQTVIKWTI